MISDILQAVQNNWTILWPLYWTQYGFDGTAPTVPFFFRPRYRSFQGAAPQVVIVLKDEPMEGPELHLPAGQADYKSGIPPNSTPRMLWRFWTRIDFYLWGTPSVLPQWQAATAYTVLDPIAPTVANQNGFWFQCTVPGTSNPLNEPAWPSTPGDTVTDGSVTWTCVSPVDDFRVFDTDVTDVMRIAMIGTLHYTLVGEWKPIRATWFDANDDLLMSGTACRLSTQVLIPVPDIAPPTATIDAFNISATLNLLVPRS